MSHSSSESKPRHRESRGGRSRGTPGGAQGGAPGRTHGRAHGGTHGRAHGGTHGPKTYPYQLACGRWQLEKSGTRLTQEEYEFVMDNAVPQDTSDANCGTTSVTDDKVSVPVLDLLKLEEPRQVIFRLTPRTPSEQVRPPRHLLPNCRLQPQ